MIEQLMNEYGYRESGTDNTLMNNVLNKDNTVGLGKNTTSETEGSWPFDQTNHSNGSTPMGSLDILSFYKKEPTPTVYYTVEAFGLGGFVDGTGTYPAGSVITLIAKPYDGWVFDRWDDGTTDKEKTVTVTGDMVFEAYFVTEY